MNTFLNILSVLLLMQITGILWFKWAFKRFMKSMDAERKEQLLGGLTENFMGDFGGWVPFLNVVLAADLTLDLFYEWRLKRKVVRITKKVLQRMKKAGKADSEEYKKIKEFHDEIQSEDT